MSITDTSASRVYLLCLKIMEAMLTLYSNASLRRMSEEENQMRCRNHEYMAMLGMRTSEAALYTSDGELRQ